MSSIWPEGIEIPVLRIVGPTMSGKSFLSQSFYPNGTLVFDLRCTASSTGVCGPKVVNIHRLAQEKGVAISSDAAFAGFVLDMARRVQQGRYSVIILDPVCDLDPGLTDLVAASHAEHGFRSPDSFKRSKGVFWGIVAYKYRRLLLTLAAKCETLILISEGVEEWDRTTGEPTGRLVPRGNRSAGELAVATIWLDTIPGTGAERQPPRAAIENCKLTRSGQNGKIHPLLPARLDVCTADALKAALKK